MALARARRGRYQANYWPGFVDMLSTLLLVVTFLMSLFMLTNYFVSPGGERQGHHAVAPQPSALRADRAACARTLPEGIDRGRAAGSPSNPRRQGQGEPAPHRAARRRRRQDARRRGQGPRARRRARHAEEDHQRRARQGRDAEPAARRAETSTELVARGARRLRGQGQGQPGQDRRSRPAAERGARQEGAGACPLPLRLLRQAEGGSRRPRRFPGGRRPLRVPLRRSVRLLARPS